MLEESFDKVTPVYDRLVRKHSEEGWESLDRQEKQVFAAIMFHEEVYNGGFLAWLTNRDSNYEEEVSAFFQECGLLNRKSLIEDAVKLAFAGELPRDVGRRRELLGKRSEKELEEIMEKLEQVSVKYNEIGYDAFYDDVVRFLKLR